MRKPVKITLSVAGSLAVLVVALLLAGLESVDYRPYFASDYYQTTVRRLREAAPPRRALREPLEAGFGRAPLTPTLNCASNDGTQGRFQWLPLAGYGARNGRPAVGVHDDLWVKAVALRAGTNVGVLVSADALLIPTEVAQAAAAQLRQNPGLARDQIYFSATHTHAGLGGWGEGRVAEAFAGPFQPAVRVWFAQQITRAAQAAMADLKPAAFGRAGFRAPGFVRNRLVGDAGVVDDEFAVLVFKQNGGRVAVLGSYAAHATVLSAGVMEFGADYPGYWQRAVERATGGTALFLAGGVGSHSPNAGQPGYTGAERMGEALAAETMKCLPGVPLTNAVSFALRGLVVDLPELHVRVSDSLRLRPSLAASLLHTGRTTRLQVCRLDDCCWVATPCDFSGELALDIKDHFAARGTRVTLTSFNGDYIGYVVPTRYYHHPGYESRLMSFYGPNTADYLDDLIRRLVSAGTGD